MTKNDMCMMCSEYSVDSVCEHKNDCEMLRLIVVVDEAGMTALIEWVDIDRTNYYDTL